MKRVLFLLHRRGMRWSLLTVLLAVLVACGCRTMKSTASSLSLPDAAKKVADSRAASREIQDAEELIKAGAAPMVIPRLIYTITKYPSSDAAQEARYLLGLAYYQMGSYRDAIDAFNEYLRVEPFGDYAETCKQYTAKLTDEYDTRYPSMEELNEKIDALSAQLEQDSGNIDYQWSLADLLWRRGDYDRAGILYKSIVQADSRYAQHETVRGRIELLPNGEYTVLRPSEIQRRDVEARPLVVVNQASFRGGHDLFTRTPRFYSVTGQVVNRSDSVLYGVQVNITVYGFGNTVYDTNTVTIGRMNPSEIRAFSVRFSNFENIENINRYECVPTFQR